MELTATTMLRAAHMPTGPSTVWLEVNGETVRAEAWGPGAEIALERVPDLIGVHDEPERLRPHHEVVSRLHRRFRGLRLGRTRSVWESALPAILEQKITGEEAWRVFRNLVRRFGDRAPGPHRLWLPPEPGTCADLPYFDYHRVGLERRRAEVIRSLARSAARFEQADRPRAARLLGAMPGIGPWTVAEVGLRAFGDPDAVSVGDYHLPGLVALALAGEPDGTDERMLELLEPYRGQRGRVIRLLELGARRPPRRGPRLTSRHLERI